MLYHIKHITLIAVVGIMLCMAMAACSDSNAEDAIAMNDVRVAFTLAVSDVRTTRAANEGWDDYDHPLPGIEKENMINPDDLYIAGTMEREFRQQLSGETDDHHASRQRGIAHH